MPQLDQIPVSAIEQDPENPRRIFPPDELERLAESIAEVGVLVPVVVHPEGNGYRLIDGDRRWQCAEQLGLSEVPAIIVDKPDDLAKLVQMFNIHQVREQWQDMPTALALGRLIEGTGIEDNRELSDQTGLSIERVKRLRHALDLPPDYQQMIFDGDVPLNFFWELKRNILDPIRNRRPDLVEKYGSLENISQSFVDKRVGDVITDTVSLRKVRPIINFSADDREDTGEDSELDPTLEDLIGNPDTTIDDAYDDTVMVTVEAPKLQRRSAAIVKGFRRLLEHASTDEEREHVVGIARELIDSLEELVS